MDKQLVRTRHIEKLVNQLSGDPEMRTNVEEIATKGRECAIKFTDMMETEGRDILIQKRILQSTSSVSQVNVHNLRKAVNAMKEPLRSLRSELFCHQTQIHIGIELCRAKRKRTELDMKSKRTSCLHIEQKIKNMTSDISSYQQDAIDFTRDAKQCRKRAKELERQKDENEKKGVGGIVVGALGIAFAPVTGGLSLGLTAVGTAYGGINLAEAADANKAAVSSSEEASKCSNEAHQLKLKCTELERDMRSAKSAIKNLEMEIDALERNEGVMNGATEDLLGFINIIDRVLGSLQNMDTVFHQTLMENDSFQIIQNAFSRNPQKLEGRAQRQLESLKSQWEETEDMLYQHGGDRLQIDGETKLYQVINGPGNMPENLKYAFVLLVLLLMVYIGVIPFAISLICIILHFVYLCLYYLLVLISFLSVLCLFLFLLRYMYTITAEIYV